MFQKFRSWFKALSGAGKNGVIIGTSLVALTATLVAAQPSTQHQTPVAPKAQSSSCSATVDYKIETQSIAFAAMTTEETTLAQGQTKVTTAGVNGEKQIKHQITVYNPAGCKPNTDVIVGEAVTKQPVDQVTAIGTYVAPAPQPSCPNGNYVNSAGNTVCSPYASSTAPSGATAKCNDGTYSFSQSRRGTCSYHGGMAEWL